MNYKRLSGKLKKAIALTLTASLIFTSVQTTTYAETAKEKTEQETTVAVTEETSDQSDKTKESNRVADTKQSESVSKVQTESEELIQTETASAGSEAETEDSSVISDEIESESSDETASSVEEQGKEPEQTEEKTTETEKQDEETPEIYNDEEKNIKVSGSEAGEVIFKTNNENADEYLLCLFDFFEDGNARLVKISPIGFTDIEGEVVVQMTLDTVEYKGNSYNIYKIENTAGVYKTSEKVFLSLELGDSVTEIGEGAFKDSNLSQITFGANSHLKIIGESAFEKSTLEGELKLPKTVEKIGNKAFAESALTSLVFEEESELSNGAEHENDMGTEVFARCKSLVSAQIPERLVRIPDSTFDSCTKLETVTYKNGGSNLLSIGKNAFRSCEKLDSRSGAIIPSSVTSIGENAFMGCKDEKFDYITIPAGVSTIMSGTFQGCVGLKTVSYADKQGIKEIQDNAFSGDVSLVNITIPSKVEKLGNSAFGKTALESVVIPATLTEAMAPFSGCENITAIEWMSGNDTVIDNLFKSCKSPIDLVIPSYIKTIGVSSFEDSKFKDVTANGVTLVEEAAFSKSAISVITSTSIAEVKKNAFLNCTNMRSELTLPALVKIGEAAFSGVSVWNVTTSSDLELIGDKAFLGCENIIYFNSFVGEDKAFLYLDDLPKLKSIGANAFNGCKTIASIQIGSNIEEIGVGAFSNQTSLVEVKFGNGTEAGKIVLGDMAFTGCTNLERIQLPESIGVIGNGAFKDCIKLLRVEFTEGLRTIGNNAFEGCYRLEGEKTYESEKYDAKGELLPDPNAFLTIPSTVTSIGDGAFKNCYEADVIVDEVSYQRGLKKLIIADHTDGTEITIGKNAFEGCQNLVNVALGEGVTSLGDNAFLNTSIKSITIPKSFEVGDATVSPFDSGENSKLVSVVFANGIKYIPQSFLKNITTLQSVTIPNTVTQIGASAMEGCTSLTDVVIENDSKLAIIEEKAFLNCNLMKISALPDTVQEIKEYAFSNCGTLAITELPEALTTIGVNAFEKCVNITVNEIPAVTLLGANAFNGCSRIEALNIHVENLAANNGIVAGMFDDCSSLKELVIDGNGTKNIAIGASAFAKCPALENVTVKDVTNIGTNAFVGCSLKTLSIDNVNQIGVGAFKESPVENVTISNVGTISAEILSGCTKLESVTLDTVTTLSEKVFYGAATDSAIEKPVINLIDVSNVGKNVLQNSGFVQLTLQGVKNVTLDTVNEEDGIKMYSPFARGSVEKIIFQDTESVCTSIARDMTALKTVVLAENTVSIADNAFDGCTSLQEIHTGETGSDNVINGVESIAAGVFKNCKALQNLALKGIININSSAANPTFAGCDSLKKVSVEGALSGESNSNTTIGISAFSGCTNLADISVKNISLINTEAFKDCGSAQGVSAKLVLENVSKIGGLAFYGCGFEEMKLPASLSSVVLASAKEGTKCSPFAGGKLKKVIFEDGITATLIGILQNVKTVEEVVLPQGLETIATDSFSGCSSMKNLHTGVDGENYVVDGVLTINNGAFSNCSSLEKITFRGIKTISSTATASTFGGCNQLKDLTIEGVDAIVNNKQTPQTVIGPAAFKGCSDLTKISLSTIGQIGTEAFRGCGINEAAEKELLLDDVLQIGGLAFYECGFGEVTIPSSVTGVILSKNDDGVSCSPFAGGYLRKVTIGDGTTAIANGLLQNVESVEEVILPTELITIGTDSFKGCGALTNIHTVGSDNNVVEGVETINAGAMNGCASLETLTIKGVKTITSLDTNETFGGCSSLHSLTVEGVVETVNSKPTVQTVIGKAAFKGCSSLAQISLTNIGQIQTEAFFECGTAEAESKELILNNVLKLDALAFYGCGFKEITVPLSITTISLGKDSNGMDCGPFAGGALETIHFEEFTSSIPQNLCVNTTSLKVVDLASIKASIKTIDKNAFKGCSGIEEITIPNGVVNLNESAFEACSALTEVEVSAKNIGTKAFKDCTNLTKVVLGEGVEVINGLAFAGTKIDTLVIPSTLTSVKTEKVNNVDYGPFAGTKITTVHGSNGQESGAIIKENVSKVVDNLFAGCDTIENVEIPENVTVIGKNAFLNATGLQTLTMIVKEAPGSLKGVQTIDTSAFKGCISLESVTLPKTLAILNSGAFEGCESLITLDMSDALSLKTWATGTFKNNYALNNVSLPTTSLISAIPASTFAGCSSLTGEGLTIPKNINTIAANAFEGAGLTTIYIPNQITSISTAAFKDCTNLENVHISNNVSEISASTFEGCSSLRTIEIPAKVTTIAAKAFYGSGLENVYIFGNVDNIGGGVSNTTKGANNQLSVFEKSLTTEGVGTSNVIYKHVFNDNFTIHSLTDGKVRTFYEEYVTEGAYTVKSLDTDGTIVIYSGNLDNRTDACMKWADLNAKEHATKAIKLDEKELFLMAKNVRVLVASIMNGETEAAEEENTVDVITWSSTDTKVATVDAKTGKVTAVNEGTCEIIAKAGEASASCSVTVRTPISDFTVTNNEQVVTSVELEGGESTKISITAKKTNGQTSDAFTVEVDDSSVITYDKETGEINALKKGDAHIVLKATDGSDKSLLFPVKVKSTQFEITDPKKFQSNDEDATYEPNSTDSWIFKSEGALEIELTFDERTKVESGSDFIKLYNGESEQIVLDEDTDNTEKLEKGYTGTELAGKTIRVSGDAIRVQLISDANGQFFGFKAGNIVITNSIKYNNAYTNKENPKKYRSDITESIVLKAPVRDGATFDGWFLDKNFTQSITEITPGTTGNLVLYAKWIVGQTNPTITYVTQGDVENPNPGSITYDNETAIILQPVTRSGYKFLGWYLDENYTERITEIPAHTIASLTIYAKWGKNPTITYVIGDGAVNPVMNPSTVEYDNANAITLVAATRDGYTFDGWYEDAGYTRKTSVIPAHTTEDITLYAKWTQAAVGPNPNPGEGEDKPGQGPTNDEVKPQSVGTTLPAAEAGGNYKVVDAGQNDPKVVFVSPADKGAKTVTVPDTVKVGGVTYKVTSIADNAFKNNKTLKKVVIRGNITSIGKNAFSGCIKLSSVTIGADVTEIKDSAFQGCKELKKVVIPAGVTQIGKKAFYKCSKLKTVTIKATGLKKIGSSAFKSMKPKATIKVPKANLKAYTKLLKKKVDKTVKIKK